MGVVMGEKVIEFDQVSKSFGGRKVLDSLTFDVERGEVFVILGPSGTGKSVTLKHAIGLIEPDSGEVRRADVRFDYLFQSGALLAWKTVWENVALPLEETMRLDADEIARRVDNALAAVGLTDAADKYPSEISGGMQKRAGLARAIVREAEVILYDEPT
jgi:phospholipid/cholesterol/gamma-HCH transport system ATP-binding protein